MREHHSAEHHEPAPTVPLPPDLAAFLRTQTRACLLLGTDRGSGFVIKAPAAEIEGLRGPIPVLFRQELYRHPSAPVIRVLLRFYDRPHADPPSSLAFESFVNVGDDGQREDYAGLARQDAVDLHFYDEALAARLSKRIANGPRADVPLVLGTALRLLARIPRDRFDFDRAKTDVIARTAL